ncbi:antitoxin [Gordonia sp. HNM0687]|uniref:Antitoxin n=1 Tax=Gordonia mangrovi TaxID=2665643 RepID=A0A6L7GRY5_9ACTN|nr:antitoxin [Gordonia mangrovi]MXP22719.1 antitoxin [Gordonia mangrovi]UVF77038.1 antitoxin [Gordonia mangrovi]
MDLKGLVDKAKNTLRGNPHLIDKGGSYVDKATGGKYAGHVDKAQDAVKKAVGAESSDAPKTQQPQQNPGQQESGRQGENPPQT